MTMSDPIADMLNRMRNAIMRVQPTLTMPHSKAKEAVAAVLKNEGYIVDYAVLPETPQAVLRIELKYQGDRRHRHAVISGMQRVSRPGRRVYVGHDEIPWVLQGMGVAILTTSQGVMSDQQARKMGIGGEVLCKVY